MKPRTLQPSRVNVGIEVLYRRRIQALIKEMQASVLRWVTATYRAHTPELAQDAVPAVRLKTVMKKLTDRWMKRFEDEGPKLVDKFFVSVKQRNDKAMQQALREAGITVKLQMTKSMKDVVAAAIAENVSLIKSIPSQYFTQIEGAVMRGVQQGRDLESLTKDIKKIYGVTQGRAETIARDQNNKATATLNRTRQLDLGLEEAIWKHSHAGKTPRKTHQKMDGKKYDIKKGMYDSAEGKYIQPGELINCRCFAQPIIPGFM